jgi:CDP-2,3-bis-(O-geranylgeranyl)-sn-glycerol synthase
MDIGLLADFITAFILYIPAMVANATPVVVGRILPRTHPIDFNVRFPDGRPLLGAGKSWEGLLGGLGAGALFGLLAHLLLPNYPLVLTAFYVPLGALLGDIAGSFLKRRLGIRRGDPLPILDQLDFYIGSTLAMILYGTFPSLTSILVMAVVIYVLHRATNYIAYRLGLKDVPW